ncbi:MAG TPA: TolC family protein [Tenuifilaceae bacterium]|nr:TolC family protein [Tenuifilaceae bacterium]
MKRYSVLCVLILGLMQLSNSLVAQQNTSDSLALDMQGSINLLLQQNPDIKVANQALMQNEYERKSARGLYMPQVGLSATFGIQNQPATLDLSPIGDALSGIYSLSAAQTQLIGNLHGITNTEAYTLLLNKTMEGIAEIKAAEWEKTLVEDKLGNVSANLTWPIFTGGKIYAANSAAKAKENENKEKVRMVSNSQITSLVQRYYGLILAVEVANVRMQVSQGMLEHLNNARKMEKNGLSPEAERLHAEVAYAEAQRELKKAQKDVELMQTALKSVLNVNQPVKPTTQLFISENILTLDDYIVRAKQQNPVFGQLDQKKIQADQAIRKERSAYLPDVAIMGSYELYGYQMPEFMPEWYVGVGLKVNIFDGLAKNNKVQAAKVQRSQVETYQEKAQLDITTGITKVYQQMLQAKEQYESSLVSLKFAQEYVRVRQKAFNEGFATSTEVVDANMNLSKVKVEQLKAMYDFDVALASLLELTGDSQSFTQYSLASN